ncbi:DUF4435 domain-containing protein [Bradyrhizobium arachidis]|uniref:DUF4435 domain-containing protein n=1 Tax=Bradyrhizobium arachidis TaxID=858423 RepID=UPI002161113A|nr:DUF4435 domain-containing protein [Bradyrhizobium arachidis]UVO31718.1 DUF4435 domain-containing protein [Bradyrhizobium arachidis]
MSPSLLTNLRQSRRSPAVLKARIISVRSREKLKPIFVFEGIDDVGPYSAWAIRCDDSIAFEPLPANGKDQILLFRAGVQPHEVYLRDRVYFFLDRDFDELKGFPAGADVFMTEMYSVENYLVSERVLESILLDEFRCAGEGIDRPLAVFRSAVTSFAEAMSPANQRIFCARRLGCGLTGSGMENRISKYVLVQLEATRPLVNYDDLKKLIPLDREPDAEEVKRIAAEFDSLDPPSRHRGKFLLQFFLKWLDLLAEERTTPTRAIFALRTQSRFSAQQMSMRSLATRSDMPTGLRDFLQQVGAHCQA